MPLTWYNDVHHRRWCSNVRNWRGARRYWCTPHPFCPWGFTWFLCLRQVPLLRGQFNARSIDYVLVYPNLFKRHSRRTPYLRAFCSKDPEGEGCLDSRALVTVSSTLYHSAIEVASNGRQHRSHPPVRMGHFLTLKQSTRIHHSSA